MLAARAALGRPARSELAMGSRENGNGKEDESGGREA